VILEPVALQVKSKLEGSSNFPTDKIMGAQKVLAPNLVFLEENILRRRKIFLSKYEGR